MASLIQDLARVIEVEGFVAGSYMAQRQEQLSKDLEDIMFAGKIQLPLGSQ
jgi:NADPH-dependent curcumin reductase CurA